MDERRSLINSSFFSINQLKYEKEERCTYFMRQGFGQRKRLNNMGLSKDEIWVISNISLIANLHFWMTTNLFTYGCYRSIRYDETILKSMNMYLYRKINALAGENWSDHHFFDQKLWEREMSMFFFISRWMSYPFRMHNKKISGRLSNKMKYLCQ